ncbi:MAG: cation transporter [Candidatus Omnitrophota bacterium]
MTIMLKALVIVVVCVSAFSRAMTTLFSEGRDINVFSAMVYCHFGVIGCLGCWLYIVRLRKKARLSGLVKAESMQWFVDILLSVTIFLVFYGL